MGPFSRRRPPNARTTSQSKRLYCGIRTVDLLNYSRRIYNSVWADRACRSRLCAKQAPSHPRTRVLTSPLIQLLPVVQKPLGPLPPTATFRAHVYMADASPLQATAVSKFARDNRWLYTIGHVPRFAHQCLNILGYLPFMIGSVSASSVYL
ncbi:hypothetical protein BD626DRAFT_263727 [Schizophyllum amplum]|uniref:Uncharacterized protein n=1 Tax=Schizophyllum amplum TaxID=97359 RepID=A0A550CGQ5_9AGAR|nr:hypothetical protein BD626DRAFT_263727 [Auriculariopsis ampla]